MRKSTLMLLAVSGCVTEPAQAATFASTPWNVVAVLLAIGMGLCLTGSVVAIGVWLWISIRIRGRAAARIRWAHAQKTDEVMADIRRGARSAAPRFKL